MTTSLDQITGNEQRSQLILRTVWAARADGDVTFEAVALKTAQEGGATFDPLSVEEFDCATNIVRLAAEQDSPVISAPDRHDITRDAAQAELKRREEALHAARQHRMLMEAERGKAREAMAAGILEYGQGGASEADIRKREIQQINADRAAKIERGDQRRPGKSFYDRARFRGVGDANDYARYGFPALSVADARKLYPNAGGPGTKGNQRGAHRTQSGPAKLHGES